MACGCGYFLEDIPLLKIEPTLLEIFLQAAFQKINLVHAPKPLGIQNGPIVGFKQWLVEKLPHRKLGQ
jgi:hypothetical protein